MRHLLTVGHNAKCGAAWSDGTTHLEWVLCVKCLRLASARQIAAADTRLRRQFEQLTKAQKRVDRARFGR